LTENASFESRVILGNEPFVGGFEIHLIDSGLHDFASVCKRIGIQKRTDTMQASGLRHIVWIYEISLSAPLSWLVDAAASTEVTLSTDVRFRPPWPYQ